MGPIVLNTADVIRLTDDDLLRLCEVNEVLHIERDREGNLVLAWISGASTSVRNATLVAELEQWNRETGLGEAFLNGGFVLPDGSMRGPKIAWIPTERLGPFSEEEQEKFLPLCPDFVIELRSPSDRLVDVRKKMHEWMDNGCRLGWLIDPIEEKTHVYRENGENSVVESFDEALSGEEVLPGFVLVLKELL